MTRETYFIYSEGDNNLPERVLNLGYYLLENRDYLEGERLKTLSPNDVPRAPSGIFYVLPELGEISRIEMGGGLKPSIGTFYYVKDRIGSAAIFLAYPAARPDQRVMAGSISLQRRTYDGERGQLKDVGQKYEDAYKRILGTIIAESIKVKNSLFPKNIYVFPAALSIIKEDFSQSPWKTIIL